MKVYNLDDELSVNGLSMVGLWFRLDDMPVCIVQNAIIHDDGTGFITAPLMKADGHPVFDYEREDYAIVTRGGKVTTISVDPCLTLQDCVCESKHPFRVENARIGELSETWNNPRPWISVS